MSLTPPSSAVFIVSLVLAVCVLLVRYAGFGIPIVNSHLFETLLIAYLLLLVGVLFKGI
ncbi:hypothetical protein V6C03_14325 [Methyloligella sp. 2.7D]|uniref:hypothetical protein n=1 Tax=unclassified Methyloligella TaxID=2625955 RepID=UPI00157BD810|nr:hypothetical protein [Methyloligella sp. GL2]QKP77069.1 hypothetical protein HT051_06140 [Methyloligella sp. GL2]